MINYVFKHYILRTPADTSCLLINTVKLPDYTSTRCAFDLESQRFFGHLPYSIQSLPTSIVRTLLGPFSKIPVLQDALEDLAELH